MIFMNHVTFSMSDSVLCTLQYFGMYQLVRTTERRPEKHKTNRGLVDILPSGLVARG